MIVIIIIQYQPYHYSARPLNAVVTCEIRNYFKIISAFVDVRPKYFYFGAQNLTEIISEAYCSSRIFSNVFDVTEIISELFFQQLK